MSSVRARTTLIAAVVVAAGLALASAGAVVALRHSQIADLRAALTLRAQSLAAGIEAGASLARPAGDEGIESFVQVLGSQGVVGATPNIEGRRAVAPRPRPGIASVVEILGFGDEEFLVVSAPAQAPSGPVTIIAGRSIENVDRSAAALTGILFVGVPAVLLLVALTTWMLTGRALSGVDAIRTEVEAISAVALHRRVPEPASGDEITRLARTMNRMLDRLENAQATQRRFISDASHELRSPVAAIRAHAEVALAYPDRADVVSLASAVAPETLRLQALIDDLLVLATAGEGMQSRPRRIVDLGSLIREVAAHAAKPIDVADVQDLSVHGDEVMLARMIRNLLDNAVRHCAETVVVSLHREEDAVVLCVDDDGPGIPASERERVFERFVRLDQARARHDGGAGLGLAIVRAIARDAGGEARAMDAPSAGGARLEVRIPFA